MTFGFICAANTYGRKTYRTRLASMLQIRSRPRIRMRCSFKVRPLHAFASYASRLLMRRSCCSYTGLESFNKLVRM